MRSFVSGLVFELFYKIVFVILILFTIAETIKYPGVVLKNTQMNVEFLIGFFILLTCFVRKPVTNRHTQIVLSVILLLVCVGLTILESLTFPNFVLSTFHIHSYGLYLLLVTTTALLIPHFLKQIGYPTKVGLMLLIYWAVSNVVGTISYINNATRPILTNPRSSYSEKMFMKWGLFFECMQLVKSVTSESASVYIPPQADVWQKEGNEYLVRYFLYPRQIIHFDTILEASKSADPYVLYSWGLSEGTRKSGPWPVEAFTATSGHFIDSAENFTFSSPLIVDQTTMSNKQTCGVIKPSFK